MISESFLAKTDRLMQIFCHLDLERSPHPSSLRADSSPQLCKRCQVTGDNRCSIRYRRLLEDVQVTD